MVEIERDLIRWRRGKWAAVVAVVFALQIGAILMGSQKRTVVREVYPKETMVALPERLQSPEWVEMDDPFLFAAANWNGFSAEAWLRKTDWKAPETGGPAPPRFLSLAEALERKPAVWQNAPFGFLEREKPRAIFPEPRETPRAAKGSELRVEGPRKLINVLAIPAQVHTDVLSRTVVEALLSADGLVISSRVIENSGSARADADALALARSARFAPKAGPERAPELAKLIFQWHALDLSATNSGLNNRTNNVERAR
jgi:TonB family protein